MKAHAQSLLNELLGSVRLDELLVILDGLCSVESHPTVGSSLLREVKPITDSVLLRAVFTAQVYDKVSAQGLFGLHALSFSVRAWLSYASALAHLTRAPHRLAELKPCVLLPGAELGGDFELMSRFEWRARTVTPLIGFSALGTYVLSDAGSCRAWDAYDLPGCPLPRADGIFCEHHLAEAWWLGEKPGATTQAKMFAYYAKPSSFDDYDAVALERLVRQFLRRAQRHSSTAAELTAALETFGLKSLVELTPDELRRRFLRAAHAVHPDKGGEAQDFVALRRAYEVLRGELTRHPE